MREQLFAPRAGVAHAGFDATAQLERQLLDTRPHVFAAGFLASACIAGARRLLIGHQRDKTAKLGPVVRRSERDLARDDSGHIRTDDCLEPHASVQTLSDFLAQKGGERFEKIDG